MLMGPRRPLLTVDKNRKTKEGGGRNYDSIAAFELGGELFFTAAAAHGPSMDSLPNCIMQKFPITVVLYRFGRGMR